MVLSIHQRKLDLVTIPFLYLLCKYTHYKRARMDNLVTADWNLFFFWICTLSRYILVEAKPKCWYSDFASKSLVKFFASLPLIERWIAKKNMKTIVLVENKKQLWKEDNNTFHWGKRFTRLQLFYNKTGPKTMEMYMN